MIAQFDLIMFAFLIESSCPTLRKPDCSRVKSVILMGAYIRLKDENSLYSALNIEKWH